MDLFSSLSHVNCSGVSSGRHPCLRRTPRQATKLARHVNGCVSYVGHLDGVPPRLQQQLSVSLQPKPRQPPFDCRHLTAQHPLRRWCWPPSASGRRGREARNGLKDWVCQAARLDWQRSCGGEGGKAAAGRPGRAVELRRSRGANGPDRRRPWKRHSCITCTNLWTLYLCDLSPNPCGWREIARKVQRCSRSAQDAAVKLGMLY